MKGFFSKKETESVSAVGGKIHSCASCGLYKHCSSPKMQPYGKFEKDIMVIGGYPKKQDDRAGKPWSGKEGRLLKHELKKHGIDLYRDCVSLNAVNCAPGKEGPQNSEIDHCRSVIVWKQIKKYQPKVILLFGQDAITSVIGYQWGGGDSVSTWRGFQIPDQTLKSWICPLDSPSHLLQIQKPEHYMTVWRDDIKNALTCADIPFPKVSSPDIRYVKDSSFLTKVQPELASFDYETTGIKPHGKGHRIVCTSIADREDRVWVFPTPTSKQGWYPFRKWLHDNSKSKMAHNFKFEHSWSKNILKVDVRNWEWDSMVAAHILDNRPGITSLKFQMYVNFGVLDYSEDVKPYLRSVDEDNGANSINRVRQLMKTKSGRRMLMKYCALDSVYQYRLALKQMEQLNYNFLPF
jgi:uracil-DNA glycosylase family 4